MLSRARSRILGVAAAALVFLLASGASATLFTLLEPIVINDSGVVGTIDPVWDLDAPVRRVAQAEVPLPYNRRLEQMALPQVEDIVRAVKDVLYQ